MKVFIDSNVWLRFLINDNKEHYEDCVNLIKRVEEGKIRPYTSSLVLMEVYYVLISVYKVAKKEAIEDIDSILEARNLTVIESTNIKEAIKLHKQTNVKLSDCLIYTQIPESIVLCSFDNDFLKLDKDRKIFKKPDEL